MSFRPLLLAATFVLALSAHARASAINECIDACFSGASCANNEAQGQNAMDCESGRDRCVKQCNDNISQGTEDPPPVTGAFGAIAYGKESGAWGLSDASKDKDGAEQSALAHCQAHGKDCEIVESFSKTCAAVAAGTGNRLGWAVSDSPKQAGLDAIQKCGESTDSHDKSRCFMQMYHCYFP